MGAAGTRTAMPVAMKLSAAVCAPGTNAPESCRLHWLTVLPQNAGLTFPLIRYWKRRRCGPEAALSAEAAWIRLAVIRFAVIRFAVIRLAVIRFTVIRLAIIRFAIVFLL